MPLFKKIIKENFTLVVWYLSEPESFFLPYLSQFSANPEKLKEIHVAQRRKEWLCSRYIGWETAKTMEPTSTGVWSDEHNKPHIKNSTLQISISHAKPFVAVLINKTQQCGVDIEEKKGKLIKLSPKFLTSDELMQSKNNLDALAIAWGAKEAVYKLYGRKQLIFKKHIFLKNLDTIHACGNLKSFLTVNNEQKNITLNYEQFNNHVLVYTID